MIIFIILIWLALGSIVSFKSFQRPAKNERFRAFKVIKDKEESNNKKPLEWNIKGPLEEISKISTKSNFKELIDRKLWFADNSYYIGQFERSNRNVVFFRPQRFGKTLFLSMLESFYDVHMKSTERNRLFKNLSVRQDKVAWKEAGKYHILRLSLASSHSINLDGSFECNTQFNRYINGQIRELFDKCGLSEVELQIYYSTENDAASALKCLSNYLKSIGGRLMVLVDEYDSMMNSIMSHNVHEYQSVVSTSVSITNFFKQMKDLESVDCIRYFITGISPLFLNDISGLNSYTDISSDPKFASMIGFTESQLERALDFIGIKENDRKQKIMEMFKAFCRGYYFLGSTEALYNPFLCSEVLSRLGDSSVVDLIVQGKINEKSFLFKNAATLSKNVIAIASQSSDAAHIAFQLESGVHEFTVNELYSKFHLSELLDPPISETLQEARKNYANYVSFLYYHGVLSLSQIYRYPEDELKLKVPNRIVYREGDMKRMRSAVGYQEIVQFFSNPTASTLKSILDEYIGQFKHIMDNKFTEGALAMHLEYIFSIVNPWTLKNQSGIEVEISVTQPNGQLGFIDFVIEYEGNIIVIELKKVHSNELKIYEDYENGFERNTCTLEDIRRRRIVSMTEFELCNLQLNDTFKLYNKNAKTVNDVIDYAIDQLNEYTKSERIVLMSTKTNIKLHKFVIVQVGFLFVVKKIQ